VRRRTRIDANSLILRIFPGRPATRFDSQAKTRPHGELLLAQGVPARVVQDILGHSAIRVTMDVYSHVMPSMRDDAAQAMNSIFGA
jgi:integrase